MRLLSIIGFAAAGGALASGCRAESETERLRDAAQADVMGEFGAGEDEGLVAVVGAFPVGRPAEQLHEQL